MPCSSKGHACATASTTKNQVSQEAALMLQERSRVLARMPHLVQIVAIASTVGEVVLGESHIKALVKLIMISSAVGSVR